MSEVDLEKRVFPSQAAYFFMETYSVERALQLVEPEFLDDYQAVYRWFINNTGYIGARPQRILGSRFSLWEQKGIRKPKELKYALTITVKKNGPYADHMQTDLGDGTWILFYHEQDTRNQTNSVATNTNNGLINCWGFGIPIGIYFEEERGKYNAALGFIDNYSNGIFTVHGPITHKNTQLQTHEPQSVIPDQLIELTFDEERIVREIEQVVRIGQNKFRKALISAYQSRCAITGSGVQEALEAAHILRYRGPKSQKTVNGLLLRADIHTLYDQNLCSVDTNHQIHIHPRLKNSEYAEFEDKKIWLPTSQADRPDQQLLEARHKLYTSMVN